MSERLESGKLPMELLLRALGPLDRLGGGASAGVRQGPGVGRDAAIVEFAGEALVAAADPITFVEAGAGHLAVAVNANDIWSVGAEPRWLLATVLAPSGSESDEVAALISDLRQACDDAGIALIGGHTEVADAVTRTVVSCAMLGAAAPEQIVPSDGAREGDVIVQAGAAAVEGTALLGHPQLLDAPGISIGAAARALRAVGGVHAMHDVTEGGVATAALELSEAAGLVPELWADEIVWLPETQVVCAARGLDPLGLLGSGTLLAAVEAAASDAALSALSRAGVDGAIIGRVAAGSGATLISGGQARALPRFARDEALSALGATDALADAPVNTPD